MTTTDKLTDEALVHRAVLDWIKEDAPIGIKMQMTPDLANKLSDRIAHRRASQAAPAPSDRLVSVGKASGLVEARVSLAARQIRQTLRDYGHRCAETSLPDLIAADVDAALRKQDELHAPAPSDGLREAVEAERERIAVALEAEADLLPCAEDAAVTRSNAALIRAIGDDIRALRRAASTEGEA